MRDAVVELGGNPEKINPICPADLVIDHSVQVDFARASDALTKNQTLEFERNKERFTFLKVTPCPISLFNQEILTLDSLL